MQRNPQLLSCPVGLPDPTPTVDRPPVSRLPLWKYFYRAMEA